MFESVLICCAFVRSLLFFSGCLICSAINLSVCGFVFMTLFQKLNRDRVFILVQPFPPPGPPVLLPSDCRWQAVHSLITHLGATEIPCSVTTSKVSIGNTFSCLSNSDKFYGNCGPLDAVYKGTGT